MGLDVHPGELSLHCRGIFPAWILLHLPSGFPAFIVQMTINNKNVFLCSCNLTIWLWQWQPWGFQWREERPLYLLEGSFRPQKCPWIKYKTYVNIRFCMHILGPLKINLSLPWNYMTQACRCNVTQPLHLHQCCLNVLLVEYFAKHLYVLLKNPLDGKSEIGRLLFVLKESATIKNFLSGPLYLFCLLFYIYILCSLPNRRKLKKIKTFLGLPFMVTSV